jgi:hypothetical protein
MLGCSMRSSPLEKYLITEQRLVHAANHRENVLSAASKAFILEAMTTAEVPAAYPQRSMMN